MLVGHTRLSSYRAIVLLGLGLTTIFYFSFGQIDWNTLSSSHWSEHSSASAIFALKIVPFWKELSQSLEDARPQCPPVETPTEPMSSHDKEWEPLIQKERPERLNISTEDETALLKAHRKMRIAAKRLAPLMPVGQDTGIVTTGGVQLFPVLLVSLRMLRRTGCTLPVQVFLGDRAEYAAVRNICEDVLPSLNARCFVVSDIYSKGTATLPDHYQFKILAILFSSFKNILFLDADSNPAHSPTPLMIVCVQQFGRGPSHANMLNTGASIHYSWSRRLARVLHPHRIFALLRYRRHSSTTYEPWDRIRTTADQQGATS